MSAADVAGTMRAMALRQRASGHERGAVLYDALIAAIAHDLKARWLITANPGDMQRCLKAVHSTVEIIDTTTVPRKGQFCTSPIKRRSHRPEESILAPRHAASVMGGF